MLGKIALWVLAAVALLALAVFAAARLGAFAGTRPEDLGVRDGRLAPCKSTPNCVSSRTNQAADPDHYVAPIALRTDPARGWSALVEIVRTGARARIVAEQPGYLRAEYASRVLAFVDDVEFQLDAGAKLVHVRSASRLGRRDFGVNRERIEAIRAQLATAGV